MSKIGISGEAERRPAQRRWITLLGGAAALALATAPLGSARAQMTPNLAASNSGQTNKTEDFVITLGGDSILMLPVIGDKDNPRFMAVVDFIRQGDAAFTNAEQVYPAETTPAGAWNPNTYMGAPAASIKELQWMGFNVFGASNNHTNDYGQQGMLDTMKAYHEAGATYAGLGMSLGAARAPGYLDTTRGRVALISTTSSLWEEGGASNGRWDSPSRPGASLLRVEKTYCVDQATFDGLAKLNGKPGITNTPDGPGGGHQPGLWGIQLAKNQVPKPGTLKFASRTYEICAKPGVVTAVYPLDLEDITKNIREGKARANYVITGIHAHDETAEGHHDPAQYAVQFAHAAIDAGSDIYAGHGPHEMRGIEIYKGHPVFYGLNAVSFQNDLTPRMPSDWYARLEMGNDATPSQGFSLRANGPGGNQEDAFWESFIARVSFKDGRARQVVLQPISLRRKGNGVPQYGIPEISTPEAGAKILARLQELSTPFGTVITVKNGRGYIDIP